MIKWSHHVDFSTIPAVGNVSKKIITVTSELTGNVLSVEALKLGSSKTSPGKLLKFRVKTVAAVAVQLSGKTRKKKRFAWSVDRPDATGCLKIFEVLRRTQ